MRKQYKSPQSQGFTLTEILTAVVIVTILVTMAVPLYEKTVERSRLAEARTILAKLQDAKWQAMDNMGCNTFSTSPNSACPKIKHLNVAFATPASTSDYSFTTRDFFFSINPGDPANGVCARRLGGDYAGTVFTYMGGSFRYTDQTHVDNAFASAPVFTCTGPGGNSGYCAAYGLTSTDGRTCN